MTAAIWKQKEKQNGCSPMKSGEIQNKKASSEWGIFPIFSVKKNVGKLVFDFRQFKITGTQRTKREQRLPGPSPDFPLNSLESFWTEGRGGVGQQNRNFETIWTAFFAALVEILFSFKMSVCVCVRVCVYSRALYFI